MKNKIYTNITTTIIKNEVYNFDNIGITQIINDRYIIPSDNILPLGVKLHIYIPAKTITNKKYTIRGDKIYNGSSSGIVTRAYYSILDNYIKVNIADNYKERTTKAKDNLRAHYPHRLNDILKKEKVTDKHIPVSLLNKSYTGVITSDTELTNKYEKSSKKISKSQREHYKEQIKAKNKRIREIKAKNKHS